MPSKKTKIVKEGSDNRNIYQARASDIALAQKNESPWKGKTGEELAREQGIRPIKDEKDFARISGGQEDWEDIDEFLRYFHSH
jgi:hypothetical protein